MFYYPVNTTSQLFSKMSAHLKVYSAIMSLFYQAKSKLGLAGVCFTCLQCVCVWANVLMWHSCAFKSFTNPPDCLSLPKRWNINVFVNLCLVIGPKGLVKVCPVFIKGEGFSGQRPPCRQAWLYISADRSLDYWSDQQEGDSIKMSSAWEEAGSGSSQEEGRTRARPAAWINDESLAFMWPVVTTLSI